MYVFFKENRLDQRFELSEDEIKSRYDEFLKSKDQDWIMRYGHQTLFSFVGEKDGLNSVADDHGYYNDMEEFLKPIRLKYYS